MIRERGRLFGRKGNSLSHWATSWQRSPESWDPEGPGPRPNSSGASGPFWRGADVGGCYTAERSRNDNVTRPGPEAVLRLLSPMHGVCQPIVGFGSRQRGKRGSFRRCRRNRIQWQCKPSPVRQKAKLPDTHESTGEDMQQKAPDELGRIQRHGLGYTRVPLSRATSETGRVAGAPESDQLAPPGSCAAVV